MRVGGQRHAPAALPPGNTRYPLYRRLGGPQGRSGLVRKKSPPPGFYPRTVQPVANRCTDWAIPAPHFLKIHLNIILPSMPGSSKWSLSLRFSHQKPVYCSNLPIRATCSTHIIPFDLITRIIFGEGYRSLSSLLCSFLRSPLPRPPSRT